MLYADVMKAFDLSSLPVPERRLLEDWDLGLQWARERDQGCILLCICITT